MPATDPYGMHLDPVTAPATTHALGATSRPTRTDEHGREFRRVLEEVRSVRDPNDIDGDGVVSDPEKLLAKLKEMAEMLALETLVNRGTVDLQRLGQAQAALNRLIGELQGRIAQGEPITREDLGDISAEAVQIYDWGREPVEDQRAESPDDNPAIDGRIEWRTERHGADRSQLQVIAAPVGVPEIQRVRWVPITDVREDANGPAEAEPST